MRNKKNSRLIFRQNAVGVDGCGEKIPLKKGDVTVYTEPVEAKLQGDKKP